jgi:hypothetical protein
LYPLFGILMAAERIHTGAGGGEAGAIFAGATSSMLVGAVYLGPVVYIASKNRRVDNKLLAIFLVATSAILAIALVALNVLLPLSTVAFVIAAAGTSAILVARAIKYVVRGQ